MLAAITRCSPSSDLSSRSQLDGVLADESNVALPV
jgi:hypothetical protein